MAYHGPTVLVHTPKAVAYHDPTVMVHTPKAVAYHDPTVLVHTPKAVAYHDPTVPGRGDVGVCVAAEEEPHHFDTPL